MVRESYVAIIFFPPKSNQKLQNLGRATTIMSKESWMSVLAMLLL